MTTIRRMMGVAILFICILFIPLTFLLPDSGSGDGSEGGPATYIAAAAVMVLVWVVGSAFYGWKLLREGRPRRLLAVTLVALEAIMVYLVYMDTQVRPHYEPAPWPGYLERYGLMLFRGMPILMLLDLFLPPWSFRPGRRVPGST